VVCYCTLCLCGSEYRLCVIIVLYFPTDAVSVYFHLVWVGGVCYYSVVSLQWVPTITLQWVLNMQTYNSGGDLPGGCESPECGPCVAFCMPRPFIECCGAGDR